MIVIKEEGNSFKIGSNKRLNWTSMNTTLSEFSKSAYDNESKIDKMAETMASSVEEAIHKSEQMNEDKIANLATSMSNLTIAAIDEFEHFDDEIYLFAMKNHNGLVEQLNEQRSTMAINETYNLS